MLKLLLITFFSLFFLQASAQIDSSELSVARDRCNIALAALELKPATAEFENFLNTVLLYTNRSILPLADINIYLKNASEILKKNKTLYDEDYHLEYLFAIVEYSKGDIIAFNTIINNSILKLKKKNRTEELIDLYIAVGNYLQTFGDKRNALKYYLEVEQEYAKHLNLLDSEASKVRFIVNANALGYCYLRLNLTDSAIKYFAFCRERAFKYNKTDWYGISSGNLGAAYLAQENYENAEEFLILDFNLSVENRIYTSAINAAFELIKINNHKKDFITSKLYLSKIDDLLKKVDSTEKEFFIEAPIKFNYAKASIFMGFKEYDSASYYYTKAIDKLLVLNKESINATKSFMRSRYKLESNVYKYSELEKSSKQNNLIALVSILLLMFASLMLTFQSKFNKQLKSKNEEIAKQSERLEELNAQKNKMFSIIAHDLRGPIGNLNSLLELESKQLIDQNEFMHYKSDVNRSLKGLSSTMENLLDWAHNSIGKGIQINIKQVDLEILIQNIIQQTNSLSTNKEIKLTFLNETNELALADESLLYIVIRNLISNAVKFTPKGKEILIKSELSPSNSNLILISIIDEGVGIDANSLNQIFKTNLKSISTIGTEGEKGTGLGLIICREFIEMMDGKIYAESILGLGSTFTIEIKKA